MIRLSYYDENTNKGLKTAVTLLKLFLRILLIVLIVMAVVYAAKKIYSLGYEAFSVKPLAENAQDAKDVTVVVTRAMSIRDIAELLNDAGLIKESEEAFIIQANAYGYADSIIPGPYVLNTSMTVQEMLEIMSTPEEEEDEK